MANRTRWLRLRSIANSRTTVLSLMVVGGCSLLLAGSMTFASGAGSHIGTSGSPSAITDLPTYVDREITALQASLNAATSDEARMFLQRKIDDLTRERERVLAARTAAGSREWMGTATAKAAELKTANAIMELTPAHFGNWLPMGDGFWVGGAVPFDIQIFLASGDWFVEIGGGTRLVVWAGVLRKDLQTSVIRVWREGKAQGFIKEVQLGSHGMAAVVGAEKRILQIRCADGTEFRFDAETLELVK